MTQKDALEQALKELGGRAHLQDIYPIALKYITHKEGSKIYDSLRGCIHDKRRFRHSPGMPTGWYELISYQDEIVKFKQEIVKRDEEISSLKRKVELLEKRPTVEDFIRRLVKATKSLFKIHRDHADYIRQALEVLGFTKDAEELASWIEHKENRLADAVEKMAEKPAVQVDIKAGAHAQISEQSIVNQHAPEKSISSNEY